MVGLEGVLGGERVDVGARLPDAADLGLKTLAVLATAVIDDKLLLVHSGIVEGEQGQSSHVVFAEGHVDAESVWELILWQRIQNHVLDLSELAEEAFGHETAFVGVLQTQPG